MLFKHKPLFIQRILTVASVPVRRLILLMVRWIWTNSCGKSALPGHTAPGSALFSGNGCQFGNFGSTVSGDLITPTIAIGPGGGILNFNYLRVGETLLWWDHLSVQVSNNNGISFTSVLSTSAGGGLIGYAMNTPTANIVWNQACYNLSNYVNQNIIIRFNFNSQDGILNNFDGIYVDDITVTVPFPLSVWQSTNNVCPGTVVTLSTNAVASFSWSTGATNPIIVVTPSVSTTFSVNSCSGAAGGTATLMVNVTPQLSLNILSSSPSSVVCTGAPVTFTANASSGIPGYSYTWQGSPSTSTHAATQQNQGVYTYTATVTDANTCNMTQTMSLSFIQSPTLISIPSQTICPSNSTTIGTSGANTFTWLPGGINTNSIVVSPSVQTTYSVTGTNTLTGCTSNALALIYMKAVPTLSFNTYSITCASLGSATVQSIGGIGPFTYTWMHTSQTNSIANNLNPGTYTLTTFDFGTGCISTATTVFTSLVPLTGNLNFSPALLCNGINLGTATFTNIAGGSGLENYFWSNGTQTTAIASPTNLSVGQWSVTVVDALTACQIFSVFTITQPPTLTLNIVASSPTSCAGTNITFTASNSGGTPGGGSAYTYTWSGGPSTETFVVSEALANNYVYTVNSTDANNCLATQTIAVDFVPNPTLSVSDVSICPLEVGTLSVSGAASYTWHTSTPLSVTTPVFTDSPVSSKQYTVIGEALSCTAAATASIIVKPTPNLFISHNSPVCENSNLIFSVSGGTSAIWSGPLAFSSALTSNTLSNSNPNQSGLYNVTLTAANSCTASNSVSLTVKPLPQFSLVPSSSSICANTTSVTLSTLTSSLFSSSSYTWLPNSGLSANSGTLVNAYPGSTTIYTVIASLNSCTFSAQSTVNVVPPPSLTAQLSSNTLCSQAFNGSPNTITLSAGGANTYSLVTVPDMFNANPAGPVSPLTAIPPYTGIGSATLSGSNGVCTVSTSLTFSILPNPNISVNNYTPVICAGETFTYTNQGASTYTWSSATPGSTLYSNGGVAVASPSINSVFSVFGGSLGCNSALHTTTITVNPLPTVQVSPDPLLLCLGNTAELLAQSNGTDFLWKPPFGLNSYTAPLVITHINQNQNYTVIASLNNCSNTAVAMVSVMPLPNAQIIPVKTEVCLFEQIQLKAQGGVWYEWKDPVLQLHNTQNLNLVASHLALSGTYTLKVTDLNSCVNYSSYPVLVHNLPGGYLVPERSEFCVPYCNSFTFVPNAQSSITNSGPWSLNNSIYSGTSFTTCFSKAETYLISGPIEDNFGCRNAVQLYVVGRPKPVASFYVTPENPVEGLDEVRFVNVTSNIVAYSWQSAGSSSTPLGMTPSTVNDWQVYKSEESSPTYVFQEAGVYGLMLMVKNEFNCWDTLMQTIEVKSDFAAYIPNAFTPNGDGLNDTFYPVLRGVKRFELQIFDRWGELIFSSNSSEQVWDGTFKGQECKQDVYNYKLVLLNVKQEEKFYSGSVMLYR